MPASPATTTTKQWAGRSATPTIFRQSNNFPRGNKTRAMASMHNHTSRRSKDPNKDASHNSKHNHNEHMLSPTPTFSVLQGVFTNPKLGSLKIPTPSIPVIPLLFMSLLLLIYEFIIVPFARKLTGRPLGITQLQRVGVGLVLSIVSTGIAWLVKVKRRDQFNKNLLKPMSHFWLAFKHMVFGIADMFAMVGLMEFFYKEAPFGMRSLSTSFALISLSFGYFLSTAFVHIINAITKKVTPSKQGGIHGDINHNNLNLFYWFLAIVSRGEPKILPRGG
ncbi:hypothetical protein LguiA_026135 [Lonicera macranthoides]